MILAMTILARDEEDILGENIAHHLDQGVDHVIVTDNLSVDGTPDIVNEYAKQGVATYIAEKSVEFDKSAWVTRMARMASTCFNARWVINADADEFWLPPAGKDLKTFFSRLLFHNLVEAPVRNFICVPDDGRPFWRRMVYADQRPDAEGAAPVKTAHRGSPALVVDADGGVSGLGRQRVKRTGVEVAHFPIRSRAQYLNKIRKAGAASAPERAAPHVLEAWRRRREELEATGAVAWLDANIIDAPTLEARISSGETVLDRRLESHFTRGRAPAARSLAIAAL